MLGLLFALSSLPAQGGDDLPAPSGLPQVGREWPTIGRSLVPTPALLAAAWLATLARRRKT